MYHFVSSFELMINGLIYFSTCFSDIIVSTHACLEVLIDTVFSVPAGENCPYMDEHFTEYEG